MSNTHYYIRPDCIGQLDDGSTYTYQGDITVKNACPEMAQVIKDCGCFPKNVQSVEVRFCPYCGAKFVRQEGL